MNRSVLMACSMAVLLFVACDLPAPPTVSDETGRISLDIGFTSITTEIQNYLAGHPVVPDSRDNVTLTQKPPDPPDPSAPVIGTAMGIYQLAGATAAFPGRVAHADMLPSVAASGTEFLVDVRLRLSNETSYRFGSVQYNATAASLCGPVLPVSAPGSPATDCQIAECAGVVNLNLKLVGAPDDLTALAALGAATAVSCRVKADMQEVAGSGYSHQAETKSLGLTTGQMRGAGGVVSVLLRADGSPTRIEVICDRIGGMFDVSRGEVYIQPQCGVAEPDYDLDLTVTQRAPVEKGTVRGLFGLDGLGLFRNSVGGGDPTLDPAVTVCCQSSNPTMPNIKTQLDGQVAGYPETWDTWDVDIEAGAGKRAWAVAYSADAYAYMSLPSTGGMNPGFDVIAGMDTDLGSTFITRPTIARGEIVLTDPGGQTLLEGLHLGPFFTVSPSGSLQANNKVRCEEWSPSCIQANGVDYVPLAEPALLLPAGASGNQGVAQAAFAGAYDEAARRYTLDYALPLTGLSPGFRPGDVQVQGLAGDARDRRLRGCDTLRTPWELSHLRLNFGPGWKVEGSQETSVNIGMERIDTRPIPASCATPSVELAPREICLCEVAATIHQPNSSGIRYYEPVMSVSTTTGSSTVVTSAGARAYGYPQDVADAAETVTVSATVPAGLGYRISNISVRKVDVAGGSDTGQYYLSQYELADGKQLKCGEGWHICASPSGDGLNAPFSVDVSGNVPSCIETDDSTHTFNLGVNVDSGGRQVQDVKWKLDDGGCQCDKDCSCDAACSCDADCATDWNLACGVPCSDSVGNMPPVTLGVDVPRDGENHTIRVRARDDTCCAGNDLAVRVTEPLSLACNNFVVLISEYEDEWRPEPADLGDYFTAVPTGGCADSPPIHADPPVEAAYAEGEWHSVTLVSGGASCQVNFYVEHKGRELAYSTAEAAGKRRVHLHRLDQPGPRLTLAAIKNLTDLEFGPGGERLATTSRSRPPMIFHAPDGTGVHVLGNTQNNFSVAFNPVDLNRVAVVIARRVLLFDEDVLTDSDAIPPTPGMSLPEIQWTPDGKRLMAIYTIPVASPAPAGEVNYRFVVTVWEVDGNGRFDQSGKRTNQTPRTSEFQETPYELILSPDSEQVLFTSQRGISEIVARTLSVEDFQRVPNDGMDITPDGQFGAYILTAAGGYKLFAMVRTDTGPFGFIPGPGVPGNAANPDVAVSPDHELIAVAVDDRIYVYRVDGSSIVEEQVINANHAAHLVFRPAPD